MAVRIVALLIPLAITLPQLQTDRPTSPASVGPAAHTQPVIAAEGSDTTWRADDAALPRVVFEAPAFDALPTIGGAATSSADLAPPQQAQRKAAARGATLKATRLATASKASAQRSVRRAGPEPMLSACEPLAHCAPVVVAKVTPVSGKSF